MALIDLAAFKKLGGEPSGKWGSTYTKMCTLIKEMDVERDPLSNYVNKKYQDKCIELEGVAKRFHPDDASESASKKGQEIAAARWLSTTIRGEFVIASICRILDKMAKNGMPLIANTGRGITQDLKDRKYSISIVDAAGTNASFSAQTLAVNPAILFAPGQEAKAIGILVHEYHHKLTRPRSPKLYPDEFVAHWKQYLATSAGADKYTNLNSYLLDAPYNMRNDPIKFAGTIFNRPEDAGEIWSKFLNNVAS